MNISDIPIYEQCKKLEAENAELKALIAQRDESITAQAEIILELKAENERLQKEIRLYDCIEKWGTKECHCACRCLGNEFCEDADKRIIKYKQTLQEIKARIPQDYNIYQWYEDVMQLITKAESEG